VLHAALGDLRQHPKALWYGGKAVAALLTAMAAALLFLSARRLELDERKSVVVALVYALGTCAWSVLSQTLWQQATDSFFLALGAFLFVRALPSTPGTARYAIGGSGLAFAIAAACRPTVFVVLAIISGYLLVARRKDLAPFAAGAVVPAAAFLVYNTATFGSPFVFGQLLALQKGGRSAWNVPVEGLAGLLVSPSRGLFVFSPVLLFAVWGIVRAWRTRGEERWSAIRVLSACAGVMILVEALTSEWWGGWSYGYRRIVDAMPLLVLGMIPIADDMVRSRGRRIAFAAAFGWSFAVQALGATAYDLDGWNARRIDGVAHDIDRPRHRHRLWSVSDSPIVYYATNYSRSRAHRFELVDLFIRQPTV
jgi:hypothetical protein